MEDSIFFLYDYSALFGKSSPRGYYLQMSSEELYVPRMPARGMRMLIGFSISVFSVFFVFFWFFLFFFCFCLFSTFLLKLNEQIIQRRHCHSDFLMWEQLKEPIYHFQIAWSMKQQNMQRHWHFVPIVQTYVQLGSL